MVPGRARIESLEAGRRALDQVAPGERAHLVVPVAEAVPSWLADLVVTAAGAQAEVTVEAEPPADLEGEALDGWEIGVCTAALAAGATEVAGIDPRRVTRVREVWAALAAHAPQPAPEPAS